ncbi:MAG: DegT/DnrJ/EryC1/StrS family aminotransferase [Oscillospiraceae bacterium]|nr:DegT/DnrJ/EryC1/StrS family aminotransferase [Candidatus Ruminococcus equi]
MSKIQVVRSSMPPYEEYCEEIKDLWENRWLTHQGPKHQQLEKDLRKYLDVDNITLFANGHLALELAIKAFGLTGEVITTPYTFASTTQAIVRNGLVPVFCDINPIDYTIDVNKIEDLITEKTSAIIPVHVYGSICDYERIEKIANKYNLKVIYDAAHAFGIKIGSKPVGTLGDASMFSFHATKVYHTVEGGGLTYSDSTLTEKLDQLKQFGMYGKDEVPTVGTNAKMTEAHAAMGLCNLRHIDEEIAKRKVAFDRYMENLGGIDGIKLMKIQDSVKHNYAYFPAVFDGYKYSRDEIERKLAENDIFARKYFYPITNEFEAYKGMFEIQQTPIAKYISERVLTLPLYADLSVDDVDRICKLIIE